MITLHGFSFSNYYNVVKHVLMHKGIPFEEDLQFGGTEEYRAISPAGKIPSMTTADGGHLSETTVLCEYLEETFPDVPLYPADAYARGQVRQVMKISELYLELPCRRLIPFVFTNTDAPEPVIAEIREVVTERGIDAMNRICSFDPYVLGAEITLADIYLRYVMAVVGIGGEKMGWDIGAEINGLKDWQARMADTDIARKIDADQEANGPAFFGHLKERFGI